MLKQSFYLSGILLAVATISPAATIIFDNQSDHPGGTLTFGTSGGNAVLAGGVIDRVTAIGGVSGTTSFSVAGSCGASFGCINFTTGAFISSNTSGTTTSYLYAGGGSLTITGTADGANGTLYSGAGFGGPVTLNYDSLTGLASLSGTLAAGSLDTILANSLGVVANTPGGTDTSSAINITFAAGNGSGMATTNSVQLNASTVPEPASFVLIGSGIAAIGLVRRRLASKA